MNWAKDAYQSGEKFEKSEVFSRRIFKSFYPLSIDQIKTLSEIFQVPKELFEADTIDVTIYSERRIK